MFKVTVFGMSTPLLILIAGPYRSGTGGDPDAIARNLERLEQAAAPLHRLGHVPLQHAPRRRAKACAA